MEAKRPNNLKEFGLKATAIYLIALFGALPAFAYMGWMTLAPFHFNELGDFLAGAFGPLAIFWLVLGFLQQGEELQHSVRALQLQAEELKHSVNAQLELVAIGNAEADARRRRLDPLFSFSTPRGVPQLHGAAWEKTKLVLRNEGADINSVEVFDANQPSRKLVNVLILKNSEFTTIDQSFSKSQLTKESPVHLQILWTRADGSRGQKTFRVWAESLTHVFSEEI